MSKQSAFDQELVAEGAYAETSGILDQLNLPPAVVKFLRDNKTILQVLGIVVVVLVVAVSLYTSYRTNRLEGGASSLSLAMSAEGEAKTQALEKVVNDYSGTPSALWALTELGHMAMQEEDFKKAGEYYSQTLEKISVTNPMYALLIFAQGQAAEAGKNYEEAYTYYITLKGVEGYNDEGYLGMARVLEAQGKNDKAISLYREYLGSIPGEARNEQLTARIEEKITRLSLQK